MHGQVGFPAVLVREDVAAQLAEAIWTYDGVPYSAWDLDGSCGEMVCDLDVTGQPAFESRSSDGYTFEVTTDDWMVRASAPDGAQTLGGYPLALDPVLKSTARNLVKPKDLKGLDYHVSYWYPPPRLGRFVVVFDKGGSEKTPVVLVDLDLPVKRLVSVTHTHG